MTRSRERQPEALNRHRGIRLVAAGLFVCGLAFIGMQAVDSRGSAAASPTQYIALSKAVIGPEPWVFDSVLSQVGRGHYWTFNAKVSSFGESPILKRAEDRLRTGLEAELDPARREIWERARASLRETLDDNADLRALLTSRSWVRVEGRTQILNVHFAHEDPDIALACNWALSYAFSDFHHDRVRRPLARSVAQLERQEDEIASSWTPRAFLLPVQAGLLSYQVSALRHRSSRLDVLAADLLAAKVRHSTLLPAVSAGPRAVPMKASLKSEIRTLRDRATTTLLRVIEQEAYNRDRPTLERMREELRRLEQMIDSRVSELSELPATAPTVDLESIADAREVALELSNEVKEELRETVARHALVKEQLADWRAKRSAWAGFRKIRLKLEKFLQVPLGPVRIFELAHGSSLYSNRSAGFALSSVISLLALGLAGSWFLWRRQRKPNSNPEAAHQIPALGPPIDPGSPDDWSRLVPVLRQRETRTFLLASSDSSTVSEAGALATALVRHGASVALFAPHSTSEPSSQTNVPSEVTIIDERVLLDQPLRVTRPEVLTAAIAPSSSSHDYVVLAGPPADREGGELLILASAADDRFMLAASTKSNRREPTLTLLQQAGTPITAWVWTQRPNASSKYEEYFDQFPIKA